MKSEADMLVQLRAQAAWRVAVTQGLTLLGFNEWLIECAHYPRALIERRASDRVARAAADEFVVMLAVDAAHRAAARGVASSIIAASENPLREPDIGRALSGSLGIALFPNHGVDADCRSIAADRRRYEARSQGTRTLRFAHG